MEKYGKLSFVSIDKDLPAYELAKGYPIFRVAFTYEKEPFNCLVGDFLTPGAFEAKPIYFFFSKEEKETVVYGSRDVVKIIDFYIELNKKDTENDG